MLNSTAKLNKKLFDLDVEQKPTRDGLLSYVRIVSGIIVILPRVNSDAIIGL